MIFLNESDTPIGLFKMTLRTVYGFSRTSTRSYFVHHTQQLAAAAQVGDAKAMRRKLIHEKMRIMQRSSAAGGRA